MSGIIMPNHMMYQQYVKTLPPGDYKFIHSVNDMRGQRFKEIIILDDSTFFQDNNFYDFLCCAHASSFSIKRISSDDYQKAIRNEM